MHAPPLAPSPHRPPNSSQFKSLTSAVLTSGPGSFNGALTIRGTSSLSALMSSLPAPSTPPERPLSCQAFDESLEAYMLDPANKTLVPANWNCPDAGIAMVKSYLYYSSDDVARKGVLRKEQRANHDRDESLCLLSVSYLLGAADSALSGYHTGTSKPVENIGLGELDRRLNVHNYYESFSVGRGEDGLAGRLRLAQSYYW